MLVPVTANAGALGQLSPTKPCRPLATANKVVSTARYKTPAPR